MTNYLYNIPVGTKVTAEGPKKRMQYYGSGLVRVGGKIVKKVSVNSIKMSR